MRSASGQPMSDAAHESHPAARAARDTAPPRTDIRTRDDVVRLVDAFYARAIRDEGIGYIFTDVARLDLGAHLLVMYDFWESTLLGARKYRGNAMQKHVELSRRTPLLESHFARWLALFESTVAELFEGETAGAAIMVARRIAGAMLRRVEPAAG